VENKYLTRLLKKDLLVLIAIAKFSSNQGHLLKRLRQSKSKMVKEKINETKKIEELQSTEQNIQNLLLQKQVFQLELVETQTALEELKKSEGDAFKIVGSLMIKAEKETLEKDLNKKKDLLDLRIKSIEKQEKELKEDLSKKRSEILKSMK
jgi:prefoldin beta subunit